MPGLSVSGSTCLLPCSSTPAIVPAQLVTGQPMPLNAAQIKPCPKPHSIVNGSGFVMSHECNVLPPILKCEKKNLAGSGCCKTQLPLSPAVKLRQPSRYKIRRGSRNSLPLDGLQEEQLTRLFANSVQSQSSRRPTLSPIASAGESPVHNATENRLASVPLLSNEQHMNFLRHSSAISQSSLKMTISSSQKMSSRSALILPQMRSLWRLACESLLDNKSIWEAGMTRDLSTKSFSGFLGNSNVSPEDPFMRKCHTVLALSHSTSTGGDTHTCVLSVQDQRLFSTTSSKWSIGNSTSSVAVDFHRLRQNSSSGTLFEDDSMQQNSASSCSRCGSVATLVAGGPNECVFCKLCLADVAISDVFQLQQCQCRFCKCCMRVYAALKIREGECTIECPDANCDCRGQLSSEEILGLVGIELAGIHSRFCLDHEVDLDPMRAWCPAANCDTPVDLKHSKREGPQYARCSRCSEVFCAACSMKWHPTRPCGSKATEALIFSVNEMIKRCPACKVPIERDAGCAQMLCKKCKHVFCWYCLASLDDDFLLRHYDKGPCKDKLGHSRASVVWHRAQVVGIFVGLAVLLVLASPVLLFVGPCVLCCKWRKCLEHAAQQDGEETSC